MGVFKHLDIDALPEGWEAAHFRDLTDYALGRTPPRNDASYWKDGTYPWVSISDMEPFGVVTDTAEQVTEKAFERVFRGQLVPKGSLLMSFKLTIGRVARLGIPALHNEAIISFMPEREKVDDRYLAYYLSQINYSDYQDKAIKGHTLNKGKIDALEIALPSLPEQQRIAQVLSTVQEAIAQQERLIRTTTELKQALMQKLFTEGLRGEALKETEIGRVPESWEVVKVMDTGTVVTGSTPSTSREDFYGGDYNLISPGDLDVTKYVNTVQKKLTALGFDQCRKLPKGAVLVGCIGNVGKVGIVADDRSATNQQINAIIPNERYDGEFLYYAMDYNRKRLEALAGKVTIPLVNKSNFERFQIAAPPINDQRLIAEALDAVDARKAVAENKRNALQDLFRTLLHELMTGKVRVGQGVSLDA